MLMIEKHTFCFETEQELKRKSLMHLQRLSARKPQIKKSEASGFFVKTCQSALLSNKQKEGSTKSKN